MDIKVETKTLQIYFWKGKLEKLPKLKHGQEFKFSKAKRNKLVDQIIEAGYSVFLRKLDEIEMVYISPDKFNQY